MDLIKKMYKVEGEDLLEAGHTYAQEGSYNITLTVSDGLATDTAPAGFRQPAVRFCWIRLGMAV